MSIITRAAVNTFAVIENFRNGSNDILDGLLPFFQPLLEKRNGVEFDSNDFAKEVSENYHWNFTADVAEELIPRFEKKGWLKSESVSLEKTTYVVCCPENSIELNDSEVYDDFKKITEEFKSFCEMLSPITALSYDIDHYQDILIEWLLYVDAYSEENLNIEYRQTVNEEKKLSIRPIIPNTTSLTDDQIYLCARFVEYAIKNNPKIADQLIQIASIGMMTEVVQDFVKPLTSVAASDLIVYLDAPIAMELLGVSGRAARENIQPIVAELQKIGVTIRIFSQSIEEIKRSLNAVLKATTRTGPTARALSQGSVLEAYVRKVASNPEKALLDQNIRVTARTLKSFPNEHEYFDDECNKDLYSSLRFQHNVAAREHDATIATFVMRQRSGYSTKDIFGSKYVILTRNGVFSQASKRACTQLGKLKSQDVGPVIHRRALAMAAWLRTGLGGEKEEVPKRQLLSSCERILSIKPHIVDAIKKFSSELNVEKAAQLELT